MCVSKLRRIFGCQTLVVAYKRVELKSQVYNKKLIWLMLIDINWQVKDTYVIAILCTLCS